MPVLKYYGRPFFIDRKGIYDEFDPCPTNKTGQELPVLLDRCAFRGLSALYEKTKLGKIDRDPEVNDQQRRQHPLIV